MKWPGLSGPSSSMEANVRVDRRLYLDSDGKIVTLDKREDAVVLFKARGGEVTPAELEQFKGQIEKFIPELRGKAKAQKSSQRSVRAHSDVESTEEGQVDHDDEEKGTQKADAPQANKKRSPKRNK